MSTSPEPQAAVCLGCGCLCDDILIRLDAEGKVAEAEGGCAAGRNWFLGDSLASDARNPAWIDFEHAPFDVAFEAALSLLRFCRAPMMAGLDCLTNQAQAAALALAERICAAVGPQIERDDQARVLATLRLGSMNASWGEIRSRADLVIFWGGLSADSPSHGFWDRFVAPPGRFIPEGRAGRTVLAASHFADPFLSRADYSLIVPFDRQSETLHLLAWLASGGTSDPGRVELATGVPFADLEAWASALRASRYGVIVVNPRLVRWPAPQAAVEALLQLVRSRNTTSRFAVTWLGEGRNPAGAEAVMTRQAGSPGPVDFSGGFPRFLPLDASKSHRYFAREYDLNITFFDDWPHGGPSINLGRNLRSNPSENSLPLRAILPTSVLGLDTPGTITRSDEIPIPLRPLRPATLPSAEEILTQLLHRLEPRP
jgi:formylmethanofuran dehydrogenase subunit B